MKHRRLIHCLQILTIPIFLFCGSGTMSSLAAHPRTEAIERLHERIPVEWDWVVINHGKVYPWPFGRMGFAIFGLGMMASMVFLIVSALYLEDWRAGKPLFGWLKPWR